MDSAVSSHAKKKKKNMPVSRVATKLVWMLVYDVIDWCPLQVMTPIALSVPGSWFTNTLTKIENELCMDCTNGLYKWITLIVVQNSVSCRISVMRQGCYRDFVIVSIPVSLIWTPEQHGKSLWWIITMSIHSIHFFSPKSQSMNISALSGIRLYLIFFQFPLLLYPCYL